MISGDKIGKRMISNELDSLEVIKLSCGSMVYQRKHFEIAFDKNDTQLWELDVIHNLIQSAPWYLKLHLLFLKFVFTLPCKFSCCIMQQVKQSLLLAGHTLIHADILLPYSWWFTIISCSRSGLLHSPNLFLHWHKISVGNTMIAIHIWFGYCGCNFVVNVPIISKMKKSVFQ